MLDNLEAKSDYLEEEHCALVMQIKLAFSSGHLRFVAKKHSVQNSTLGDLLDISAGVYLVDISDLLCPKQNLFPLFEPALPTLTQ